MFCQEAGILTKQKEEEEEEVGRRAPSLVAAACAGVTGRVGEGTDWGDFVS